MDSAAHALPTVIHHPTKISNSVYTAFSCIVFLRSFLFGRSKWDLNPFPPTLLHGQHAIHLHHTSNLCRSNPDVVQSSIGLACTCGILYRDLYSLRNGCSGTVFFISLRFLSTYILYHTLHLMSILFVKIIYIFSKEFQEVHKEKFNDG